MILASLAVKTYQLQYQDPMNLSPSRAQPLHYASKPRVAFTYQTNCNAAKPTIRTEIVQPSPCMTKQMVGTGVEKTPTKVENKQNSFRSPPSARQATTNFQLQEQEANSPQLKLPPLSPRVATKKAQPKCPSFLAHKTKNEDPLEAGSQSKQVNQKCLCGKPTTHQYSQTQGCCSKCGIQKMMQGYELRPLTILGDPKEGEKNCTSKSVILQKLTLTSSQNCREKLMKEVAEEKQVLESQLKEALGSEEQSIGLFYRERKQDLKTHYQKIKSAIKESIDQDLKQLEVLEKEELQEWRKSVGSLQEDLQKLQRLESEIKEKGEESSGNREELLEQYRLVTRNRRASKVGVADADTINVSRLSNPGSHLSSKYGNPNSEVYRPDIYRMVEGPMRSARSSDLLSVSAVSENTQQAGQGSKIEGKGQERKSKNVLFSFEAKK